MDTCTSPQLRSVRGPSGRSQCSQDKDKDKVKDKDKGQGQGQDKDKDKDKANTPFYV